MHHDPRTHPYQVIEPHSIPIFDETWGADEELLLLEGAEQYGLGSWADVADHIGGYRDKNEVRDHYIATYIDSLAFPLPEHASPFDTTLSDSIPREEFQARKKRRIDERKQEREESLTVVPTPGKPTSSVPSCHEVAGFMPGRLEFENEYFNEAEEAVQHMVFSPDEGINPGTGLFDPETDLKIVVMGIYNDRLTQRTDRKKVIISHKLLEYRKNLAVDKKRTKEQRELHQKLKPFARMMSHPDFVTFSEDLEMEQNLRQAIAQLQEWRRMRISTLGVGDKYENEKNARMQRNSQAQGTLDRLANGVRKAVPPPETADAVVKYTTAELPVRLTGPPTQTSSATTAISTNGTMDTSPKRPPLQPIPNLTPLRLDADSAPDLHLLLRPEQDLCSKLRLSPKVYLCIKNEIMKEAMKNEGKLKKKNVRELSRVDTTKGGRIFEFLVDMGWIAKSAKS